MKPLRLVFDTTMYIAAALRRGSYADQWFARSEKDSRYKLYSSPPILNEVTETLQERFSYTTNRVNQFLDSVENFLCIVHPVRRIEAVPNDPDDNIILECAVAAKADIIISADPHLYKLKRFENIQIFHPNALKHIFPDEWVG